MMYIRKLERFQFKKSTPRTVGGVFVFAKRLSKTVPNKSGHVA